MEVVFCCVGIAPTTPTSQSHSFTISSSWKWLCSSFFDLWQKQSIRGQARASVDLLEVDTGVPRDCLPAAIDGRVWQEKESHGGSTEIDLVVVVVVVVSAAVVVYGLYTFSNFKVKVYDVTGVLLLHRPLRPCEVPTAGHGPTPRRPRPGLQPCLQQSEGPVPERGQGGP